MPALLEKLSKIETEIKDQSKDYNEKYYNQSAEFNKRFDTIVAVGVGVPVAATFASLGIAFLITTQVRVKKRSTNKQ